MAPRMKWYICVAVILLYTQELDSGSVCITGYYGDGCRYECHCAGRVRCDPTSGKCPHGCQQSWSGSACQTENVAFGKKTRQRTTYGGNSADKAVDWGAGDETCAKTRPGFPGSWRVDLRRKYDVYRLYLKTDAGGDLKGVRVYVSDTRDLVSSTLCSTVPLYSDQTTLTCEVPLAGRYVHVVNTKHQLVLCDVQILVCSDFRFGMADCDGMCHCKDQGEICDKTFGTCTSGCATGWGGANCQSPCEGTYGPGCQTPCGHCQEGAVCDPQSGHCQDGCDPGWRGSTCDEACVPGSYGAGCVYLCGHCLRSSCDAVSGECRRGCDAGWTGPRCDVPCRAGQYGENCAFTCGACRMGSTCDGETGLCPQGCAKGWRGVFCTLECRPGTYGVDCSETCKNCNSGTCNRTTGLCDVRGCKLGWSGPKCDHKCPPGMFGMSCEKKCGNCLTGEACDPQSGACPSGCADGWAGPHCDQGCKRGFYGEDCAVACGACHEGMACHHVTGKCPGECTHGYSGPLCQKKLLIDPTRNLLTGVVLGTGTVVFGSLIVFILCMVVRWRQDSIQDDGDGDEKRTERRAPLLKRLDSG